MTYYTWIRRFLPILLTLWSFFRTSRRIMLDLISFFWNTDILLVFLGNYLDFRIVHPAELFRINSVPDVLWGNYISLIGDVSTNGMLLFPWHKLRILILNLIFFEQLVRFFLWLALWRRSLLLRWHSSILASMRLVFSLFFMFLYLADIWELLLWFRIVKFHIFIRTGLVIVHTTKHGSRRFF